MNYENITPQSQKVSEAILELQEMEGGMGCNIKELSRETAIPVAALRGNLTDLIQRGIIEVDLSAQSGATCNMYYHNGYEY